MDDPANAFHTELNSRLERTVGNLTCRNVALELQVEHLTQQLTATSEALEGSQRQLEEITKMLSPEQGANGEQV